MKQFSLPEVDSLDEVPEDYKSFYFVSEGKVQRQKPDMLVSTLNKIKRDNERVAAELLETKNALALYKEALGEDADPERLRALKEKAAKADSLTSDEDVEKRIATVKAAHDREIEKIRAVIKDREESLEEYAVMSAVRDALKQVDADEDALDLLPQKIRSRLKVEFKDKKVNVSVLNEDGSQKIRDDGQDATLLDLANEFKSTRPKLFNGTKNTGAGGMPDAFQIPAGQKSWWKMTDSERIEYARKNGKEKAQAFMAASPQS